MAWDINTLNEEKKKKAKTYLVVLGTVIVLAIIYVIWRIL